MRDTREFELFYQRHFHRIYRFAYFRCGQNRSLAEDLASEIFLKALDKFDTYDPRLSRTAWIMTVARNHVINYWRDRKETLPLERLTEDGESSTEEMDVRLLSLSLERHGRQTAVYELAQLLPKLSPKDRELVTLHYLDGYGYKDIAAALDLTETAVKVAVHRALKRLRSHL